MKLNVGDQVQWRQLDEDGSPIIRQITEVRQTGYSWIYPDIPDQEFMSENSNMPFFENGWRKNSK